MSEIGACCSLPNIQRGIYEITGTTAITTAVELAQKKAESIMDDDNPLGRYIDVMA